MDGWLVALARSLDESQAPSLFSVQTGPLLRQALLLAAAESTARRVLSHLHVGCQASPGEKRGEKRPDFQLLLRWAMPFR